MKMPTDAPISEVTATVTITEKELVALRSGQVPARLLDEASSAVDAARVAATRAQEPCRLSQDGSHTWDVTEDGYGRTWYTEYDVSEDGQPTNITAAAEAPEWSSDAAGFEYLACVCGARMNVPLDEEIEYQ